MKLSHTAALILQSIELGEGYGFDIMTATGLPSGTVYPALLKLEQEGFVASEWGVSDNNRKAKYYRLTAAGRKRVNREAAAWTQTTAILARFLNMEEAK